MLVADHRQNQRAKRLETAAAGGQVALEQGGIDVLGGLTHGRGKRAGRLVELCGGILEQVMQLESREGGVSGYHEIHDQGIVLAPARSSARRGEGHQARQFRRFLPVDSVNGENV